MDKIKTTAGDILSGIMTILLSIGMLGLAMGILIGLLCSLL